MRMSERERAVERERVRIPSFSPLSLWERWMGAHVMEDRRLAGSLWQNGGMQPHANVPTGRRQGPRLTSSQSQLL